MNNLLTLALQHKNAPMTQEVAKNAALAMIAEVDATDTCLDFAYERPEMRQLVRDYNLPNSADEMLALYDFFTFAFADFVPFHEYEPFMIDATFNSAADFFEHLLLFNLHENDDLEPVKLAIEVDILDASVLDDYEPLSA